MTDYTHTITRNLPPPKPWESAGPGNRPLRKGTPCRVLSSPFGGIVHVEYEADGEPCLQRVPESAVTERVQRDLGL